MRRQLRFAWLALAIGLLFCFGGSADSESPTKKVTLQLKNADVMDALALVAKAGLTYSFQGDVPRDLRVTISLQNADPETALRAICEAAGLDCRSTPNGWVIYAPGFNAAGAPTSMVSHKITREFKDAPVVDVIAEINKDLPQPASIVFASGFPKDLRVTLSLRDAIPEEALQLVIRAAGLKVEETSQGVIISVAPTANVGGARVPIVGAAAAVSGRNIVVRKDEHGRIVEILVDGEPIALPGAPPAAAFARSSVIAPMSLPSFKGDANLADLDVRDAPIGDVMARLSKASGVPIHVHEAVPKDIKVTAKLYRMPLGQVLSMIMDQANLAYAVERTKDPIAKDKLEAGLMSQAEYEASEGQPEIHIVPKPELRVSGAGMRPGVYPAYPTYPFAGAASGLQVQQLPQKLLGHCPKCHTNLLSREWKFCPYCGAKLPPPVKQKVAPKSMAP